jgi:hypothetical protein
MILYYDSKVISISQFTILNNINIFSTRIIGICCFTAKHAALRRKSKDWLATRGLSVVSVG